MELDDVTGLGHAEGTTRVEMIPADAIGRAAHDVVVEYAGR